MIAGAQLTADGTAVACLYPMPDRCQARADEVRQAAERAGIVGQSTDALIIARRIAWDAHAASEYPRPMMSDAIDLCALYPASTSVIWHLVAGATILGAGCDCQPPAHHRDELVKLAVIIAGDGLRRVAAESERVPVPVGADGWPVAGAL